MDFSVIKLFLYKIKYFLISYLPPIAQLMLRQNRLSKIKELHNKYSGPAVIVANGKNVKIFLENEHLPKDTREATIFGLNDYLRHSSNKTSLHF